jgi:hypothetical protein
VSSSSLGQSEEVESSSPYIDHPDHLPLGAGTAESIERHDYAELDDRHHHLQDATDMQDRCSPTIRCPNPDDSYEPRHVAILDEYAGLDTALVLMRTDGAEDIAAVIGSAPSQHPHLQGKDEPDLTHQLHDEYQTTMDCNSVALHPALDDFDDEGLTLPYEPSDEEDDDDGLSLCPDARFCDAGWGIESLHETEDIDFEFVYALHTFVATVEGQANATKGDTMVLLDDSNSYWWLVRVVKDSSIGKSLYESPVLRVEALTRGCRLPTSRAHRDTDGEVGTTEQAQKH